MMPTVFQNDYCHKKICCRLKKVLSTIFSKSNNDKKRKKKEEDSDMFVIGILSD